MFSEKQAKQNTLCMYCYFSLTLSRFLYDIIIQEVISCGEKAICVEKALTMDFTFCYVLLVGLIKQHTLQSMYTNISISQNVKKVK